MKRILVSFDIDGTLEVGDPPGPVTLDMVRKAKELGCIIGSCSDRSLATQQMIWDQNNIVADFTSLKYKLGDLKGRFEADVYLHTGDTEMDRQFAREAGFDFYWMSAAADEPWIALRDGSQPA